MMRSNRLGTRTPGGALVFAGSVNEPATLRIAGRPAIVDANNIFRGVAPVPSATSVVTVTATDASGNTATQDYEIDLTSATTAYSYSRWIIGTP